MLSLLSEGEKKRISLWSSTQNYPQVATGECYDVGFGGWGHIIIITAANDVFGVLKKCGTHCWNFDSVSLCYTANSRKSHFHTLHWKSEATIKISLLQNTQFMLSVPKMKAKLHPWLHSRLVQLCSYVCVHVCVRACTCKFYNGYSTILQAFCLYLQCFPPSLKLTLNVTKLDRYCSITQCNMHRELTIQNINLQNSSLDESSSITRLVTACRGDECVTASSSRGADSISLIPALHDRLALVK